MEMREHFPKSFISKTNPIENKASIPTPELRLNPPVCYTTKRTRLQTWISKIEVSPFK